MSTGFYGAVEKISEYIPEVPKPPRKPTLHTRFLWTLIALVIYVVMGYVPLYKAAVVGQTFLPFYQIIFAAREGTLTSLGIGPIVTGGLVAEILVGSDIIKLDFSKPEDRKAFTALTKALTIFFIAFESIMYAIGRMGFYFHVPSGALPVDILQLILAGFIIYLLDAMLQKGWGIGSGISLFILTGVALSILVDLFNPATVSNQYFGLVPFAVQAISSGQPYLMLVRPEMFPSVLGLIATIIFILVLIYLEGIRVEIPITSARFRGFSGTYPIKLLYVSNIPVILVGALMANLQIVVMGMAGWLQHSKSWISSILAVYEQTSNGPHLVGGILYYLLGPRDFYHAIQDPLMTTTFVAVMIVLSVIFAKLWVEMSGMNPAKTAENLLRAQVTVPGFRTTKSSVKMILERWIPSVTLIGGGIVGLVAGVSQFLGVFGGGIGILLMVDIAIQYYQILLQEELELIMPRLAGIFRR